MACAEKKLTKNLVKNCTHAPKQGVGRKFAVAISDIDKTSTQLSADGTEVTTLVLESGAKVYELEGNVKVHGASFELVEKEFGDYYNHKDTYKITYRGAAQRARVQEMIGGRFATIVQKIDTGDSGEIEWEILGYESGMKPKAHSADLAAGSGVATLELGTVEGEEEKTEPKLWTESTGWDTWIDANLFVPA